MRKSHTQNDEQRVTNASRMVDGALARGMPLRDIFMDALVFPISAAGQPIWEPLPGSHPAARRANYGPGNPHVAGGLSNVSFGLPCRKLINDVPQARG